MLTCQYCGATSRKDGRVFEKQGQLNLHEYHCKMKYVAKREGEIENCKHDFRLLNLNSTIENKAYQHGYKEVCSKCQDLK